MSIWNWRIWPWTTRELGGDLNRRLTWLENVIGIGKQPGICTVVGALASLRQDNARDKLRAELEKAGCLDVEAMIAIREEIGHIIKWPHIEVHEPREIVQVLMERHPALFRKENKDNEGHNAKPKRKRTHHAK